MFMKIKLGTAAACILAAVLCFSGQAMAESRLLVGHTGGEWFAGIHGESVSRRFLGFVGYQEDAVAGILAVTKEPRLMGYVQAGRQVFVGNVKYAVAAYGGNPDFLSSLSGENRLGVKAEYKQLLGKEAAGISGEVNFFGKPGFSLKPYVEFRGEGVFTAQVEFGTEGIALGLAYNFKPASNLDAAVSAVYDFAQSAVDCGASFILADIMAVSGAWNGIDGTRLDLAVKGVDHPLEFGMNWRKGQVQWYAGWKVSM